MKQNLSGITLIELLITISILAIMSVFSFQALHDYNQNRDLQNSAKQLISSLRKAQQDAVTQQIKHALRVIPSTADYQIIKKSQPETIIGQYSILNNIIFSQITGLNNNEAVYNSVGAVDFNGEIYLIHQQTNSSIKVIIEPSGYVTMENL